MDNKIELSDQVISLDEAMAMGTKAKGKVSRFVYIRPMSPIHGPDDWYNQQQEFKLIPWEDLVRYYQYSCVEGRYFNAYTKEELKTNAI